MQPYALDLVGQLGCTCPAILRTPYEILEDLLRDFFACHSPSPSYAIRKPKRSSAGASTDPYGDPSARTHQGLSNFTVQDCTVTTKAREGASNWGLSHATRPSISLAP